MSSNTHVSLDSGILRSCAYSTFLVWRSGADYRVSAQARIFAKVSEGVRFARRRFGHYEVVDFLAVLFGYAISGERTLESFYERLRPFAVPFMALFERDRRSRVHFVVPLLQTSVFLRLVLFPFSGWLFDPSCLPSFPLFSLLFLLHSRRKEPILDNPRTSKQYLALQQPRWAIRRKSGKSTFSQ